VIKHTDGKTWALLDRMVEAGIDGYQAIQPSAGMDIRELKRRYGKRLTFWGAIECGLLVAGTVEDVRREVEYDLKYGAPGGGFILGSANTIQYGAKYENYMAMLETLRAKGSYPITI
jgi:uroporphyrinogen decarboxylase